MSKAVTAGRYSRCRRGNAYPVSIKKYSSRQDPATGEVINGWVQVSRVWADIEGISGREFMATQSLQSESV
ncbi:phage head completion protein [Pseudomonas syringae]|uniref:Head-tail adaptor protein n=1 Tax=Pseudomonas syringae pv. actinidifoliorum ICMP 18803 TaxID=1194400 RepID=A0AAT9SI86_PSESX|nr:head-tail adaptor protein [Pseudomonas syringae pv. actinidifoliorum]NAT37447.1 head-tail adaptor protein [Pseudomonas syringae pv. actinidifoliorum]OOK93109.1 hypothetical protein B0B36_29565 [Pseudomonas syringae pv. actinidifoliorum]UYS81458.1 head-tail adaptor protein [Pseudomonas syringae pv. actinidifoliorum ICMP 18803]